MGERKQTTVNPAKNLAAGGVSLLFMHKNTAGISVFSCFALALRLMAYPFCAVMSDHTRLLTAWINTHNHKTPVRKYPVKERCQYNGQQCRPAE